MRRASVSTGVAVVLAAAVAGCGGSAKTKTVTVTSPSTTTSVNPATLTNPNNGSDYPAAFRTKFLQACEKNARHSTCTCLLANLQSHATYQRVAQEEIAGTFIGSPEYKLAIQSCANH